MAARMTVAEFDAKLKSGTLTPAEYRRYLEVDPQAEKVRVQFKPGSLRDAPPPGYDVDHEVYLAERAKQERRLSTRAFDARKRVLAEGDSWFNLPPFIRPQAIADRLDSNKRVVLKNIARWGHTLSQMLKAKEYLVEIPKFKPDWFILSGGGNDLQESLARGELVLAYDPDRPVDQCLSAKGVALLHSIAEGYRTLLDEIGAADSALPSICYGYDFPRPTYKGGKYIGRHLKKMGYPPNTWEAVGQVLIDRLTAVIVPVLSDFPNALFLDCRRTTASHPFYDDMHPDTGGFKALAHKFEQALGVAVARAAATKVHRRISAKGKAKAKAKARKAARRVPAARSPAHRLQAGKSRKPKSRGISRRK